MKNLTSPHPDDPTTLSPKDLSTLDVYYVPLDRMVSFKAFIVEFSDQYGTTWNEEEVYGRMDSVQTFKSTTRNITVSFDVVAASESEAKYNLAKVSELASMHYPVYNEKIKSSGAAGSTTALDQAPLLRVKYANWICRSDNPLGSVKESGLLVASSGFSFTPQMDDLVFGSGGMLYPKLVRISLSLKVIHEHHMGFTGEEGGEKRVRAFPYNSDVPELERDLKAFAEVSQEIALEESVASGDATQEEIDAIIASMTEPLGTVR